MRPPRRPLTARSSSLGPASTSVLLWFVGTASLSVWLIFGDPRFDHRLLALGAVLPDLVDAPFGQARFAHSVVVAFALLTAVMLVTVGRGRRDVRRRVLAVPIGVLLHLVWDGSFASTDVFWWPFTGSWGDVEAGSVARGWWNVPLELGGLAMVAWLGRRCGLGDEARRRRFWTTGQLIETGSAP